MARCPPRSPNSAQTDLPLDGRAHATGPMTGALRILGPHADRPRPGRGVPAGRPRAVGRGGRQGTRPHGRARAGGRHRPTAHDDLRRHHPRAPVHGGRRTGTGRGRLPRQRPLRAGPHRRRHAGRRVGCAPTRRRGGRAGTGGGGARARGHVDPARPDAASRRSPPRSSAPRWRTSCSTWLPSCCTAAPVGRTPPTPSASTCTPARSAPTRSARRRPAPSRPTRWTPTSMPSPAWITRLGADRPELRGRHDRRHPLPRRRGIRRPAARRHDRRRHRLPPGPRRAGRRAGRGDRPHRAAPRRDRRPVRHDRHLPAPRAACGLASPRRSARPARPRRSTPSRRRR